MPERPLTEPIQVVQLNLNRSPDVSDTDILLCQESAFSTSTLPQHLYLTPKIQNNTIDRPTKDATSEPNPQSDGLRPRAE